MRFILLPAELLLLMSSLCVYEYLIWLHYISPLMQINEDCKVNLTAGFGKINYIGRAKAYRSKITCTRRKIS
jgi:hypothetical protein